MKFLQIATIAAVAIHCPNADAFAPVAGSSARGALVVVSGSNNSNAATLVENLPSVEELNTAPFMKQVSYGSDMTDALTAHHNSDDSNDSDGDSNTLRAALSAQLSHSDGIRGFMVAYLTGSYESSTDDSGGIDASQVANTETDPTVLLETIHGLLAADQKEDELVPLMCMNVVMPIAMITMHQDPALSAASKLTAARGIRLLGSVMEASGSIKENLSALLEAATKAEPTSDDDDDDDEDEKELVKYWTAFFGKWGYEDPQKEDIAATMKELLSKSSE